MGYKLNRKLEKQREQREKSRIIKKIQNNTSRNVTITKADVQESLLKSDINRLDTFLGRCAPLRKTIEYGRNRAYFRINYNEDKIYNKLIPWLNENQ